MAPSILPVRRGIIGRRATSISMPPEIMGRIFFFNGENKKGACARPDDVIDRLPELCPRSGHLSASMSRPCMARGCLSTVAPRCHLLDGLFDIGDRFQPQP